MGVGGCRNRERELRLGSTVYALGLHKQTGVNQVLTRKVKKPSLVLNPQGFGQGKTHIFRNANYFFRRTCTQLLQSRNNLLHQYFGSGGASRNPNIIFACKPLGINALWTVDQVGIGTTTFGQLTQAIRVGAVVRTNDENHVTL